MELKACKWYTLNIVRCYEFAAEVARTAGNDPAGVRLWDRYMGLAAYLEMRRERERQRNIHAHWYPTSWGTI